MTIKEQYENAVNNYIVKFYEKQDMEFNGWVADEIGEIAEVNDFYFNFSDIKKDIDLKAKKGLIIDWYNECVDAETNINYRTWLKLKK